MRNKKEADIKLAGVPNKGELHVRHSLLYIIEVILDGFRNVPGMSFPENMFNVNVYFKNVHYVKPLLDIFYVASGDTSSSSNESRPGTFFKMCQRS